jgi:hypothetical protein
VVSTARGVGRKEAGRAQSVQLVARLRAAAAAARSRAPCGGGALTGTLPGDRIPSHQPPPGGSGYKDETVVEYDLDNEDEDWLETYNTGRLKLRWGPGLWGAERRVRRRRRSGALEGGAGPGRQRRAA